MGRRPEAVDVLGGVTRLGPSVMTMADAVGGALFLAASFMAMLLLRRLKLPSAF